MKLQYTKITYLVVAISIGLALSLVTADSHNRTTGGTLNLEHKSDFSIATIVENSSTFTSKIINTPSSFNAISFGWTESQETKAEVYVRTMSQDWSSWQKLERDYDNENPRNIINTQLLFTDYTNILQYQIKYYSAQEKSLVSNFKLNYIDATRTGNSIFKAATVNEVQDLNIISRAQWGADETLRYDETGNEIWPKEYYTPKKFVVHHSASKNETDPLTTVRSIYFWHAKSQGWGDIGYNYLIDSKGNIYEGRAGGDGVVGAHTYMNNRNTIGIVIIGCYHPEKGCNTPENLTTETQASLEKLISYKSRQFGLSPDGAGNFNQKTSVANIIGHRDLGHTNCPGDNIYKTLGVIRTQSTTRLASLPAIEEKTVLATLNSPTSIRVEIPEGTTKNVQVSFTNKGQVTWRGYADDQMVVSTESKRLGILGSLRLATLSEKSVSGFGMKEGNVTPGQVGTFEITLPAENDTRTYTLAWNGRGYVQNTDFTIQTVVVANPELTPVVPIVPTYLALVESSSIPTTLKTGENGEASLSFINLGNVSWNPGEINLEVSLISEGQENIFSSITYPLINVVEPNAKATFTLPYKTSEKFGEQIYTIRLSHTTNEIINFAQEIIIVPPYSATIVSQNFPAAVKNTWRPTVTLILKNNGSKDWVNPTLSSTDVDGTLSWFVDSSWQAKKVIKTIKKTIKPGEEVTFTFKLKAYWKTGTYPHLYKLKTGAQTIVIDGMDIMEKQTRIDK